MIELSVDQQRDGLAALARAIKSGGADAGTLKKELAAELRKVMEPVVAEQKTNVMRIASSGHPGQGLRAAVARQTKAGVRFSGRNVGVNITQRARAMPRDFRFAGRVLNREEGWSPVGAGGSPHHQAANVDQWFDHPGRGAAKDALAATSRVLERMAERLAAKIRSS